MRPTNNSTHNMDESNCSAHGTNSRSKQFDTTHPEGQSHQSLQDTSTQQSFCFIKTSIKEQKNMLKKHQERRLHQEHQERRLHSPVSSLKTAENNAQGEEKTKALQSGELTPPTQKPPAKKKKKSSRELFYKIEDLEKEIAALNIKLEETQRDRDHQMSRADLLQKQLDMRAREDETLQRPPVSTKASEEDAYKSALERAGLKEALEIERQNSAGEAKQSEEEVLRDTRNLCLDLYTTVNTLEDEIRDEIRHRLELTKNFTIENNSLCQKIKDLEGEASMQKDSFSKELQEARQSRDALEKEKEALNIKLEETQTDRDHQTSRADLLHEQMDEKALEVEALKFEVSNQEGLLCKQVAHSRELFCQLTAVMRAQQQAQKDSSLLCISRTVVQEAISAAVQETTNEELHHQADDFQKKVEEAREVFQEIEEITMWRKVKKFFTPKSRRRFKLQTRLTQLGLQ